MHFATTGADFKNLGPFRFPFRDGVTYSPQPQNGHLPENLTLQGNILVESDGILLISIRFWLTK
jgi:hypothetical protein